METILFLLACVTVLAALGTAALAFGVDSRDPIEDAHKGIGVRN